MRNSFTISILLLAFSILALPAPAQMPVPAPTPAYVPLTDQQLDTILGPIALYPDPLIAQILPASTLPTQVVLADRYVIGGGDVNQLNQQPWDTSVQAVARYPGVLKWMDTNLEQTTELGQAFLYQQPAVMASIQRLRASASRLGNLRTTSQQIVTTNNDDIEIDPADVQVMYVPVYQSDQVYYDEGIDNSPFISFGIGYPFGGWMDNDFDWGNNNIIVWNRDHNRSSNYWQQHGRQRDRNGSTPWRSGDHRDNGLGHRGDRGWSRAPTPAETRIDSARTAAAAQQAATHRDRGPGNAPALAPLPGAKTDATLPGAATPGQTQKDRGKNVPPGAAPAKSAKADAAPPAPPAKAPKDRALNGIQNPSQTRAASVRGQQSAQAVRPSPKPQPAPPQHTAPIQRSAPVEHAAAAQHSAPAQRSAPAQHFAPSGGGGGHNGGGGGGGGGGKDGGKH